MVTIRDIAQRLGIAVSTVSKGLNGAPDVSAETRQLVLDTAVEMGYAAKRARRQAQPKVCVLVENMEYANIGQFGYEIVAGFRLAAAARGWAVDVLPTTPEAQARTKYGSLLLEGGYGGAFILGLTPQDAYMRALAGTGTPTVLLDNCVPNASVGYVGTDSWEGVELGVRHLAGLGHRKIAFLNGTRDSMVSEERRLAFLHATWLCGLSADERMMAYGYYEQNCAREYVPHFLAQGCDSHPVRQRRHRPRGAGRAAASGPARARGRERDGLRRPSAGRRLRTAPYHHPAGQAGAGQKCVQPAGQSDERCCRKQGAAASAADRPGEHRACACTEIGPRKNKKALRSHSGC